jgi:RNA polymerase sigma-70 factor (ECF subfamily)
MTKGSKVILASIPKGVISDQLVSQAKLSKNALEELVNRCLPRIRKIVGLSCGGGADGDDLVQQAIITVVEKLDNYHGPERFTAWLDRLTINIVRMHFRKNALRVKRIKALDVSSVDICDLKTPECHELNRQLYLKIGLHISKLKQKYRTAVVLSMMHGYSAREIAGLSGCSEDAAWKRIQRGFKSLRKRIENDAELKMMLEWGGR